MAELNLATVELVSTLRAAPQNGSPSSQDYNDSWTESLADLASLSGFINDILIPMLNGLNAPIQPNPNAAPNGLEGKYIFGDTSDTTSLFFDSLSSSSLSLADSLRILNGIVTTVQTAITDLTVQVTSLQTQLSSTNQNDVAQALQNFSASLQALQAQVVANTQSISESVASVQLAPTVNQVISGGHLLENDGGFNTEGTAGPGGSSFQSISGDLTLDPAAGDNTSTHFFAGMMGNLFGNALTKTKNYLGGLIGHYSTTGSGNSTYPKGAVLAGIGDGSTDADGAVVAYIDGDSNPPTNAGAAFKVRNNNSNAGSGFNYGMDLSDASHDSYLAVSYKIGEVRLSNGQEIYTGSASTRNAVRTQVGTQGAIGSVYASSAGKMYLKVAAGNADTDWELVTTTAVD